MYLIHPINQYYCDIAFQNSNNNSSSRKKYTTFATISNWTSVPMYVEIKIKKAARIIKTIKLQTGRESERDDFIGKRHTQKRNELLINKFREIASFHWKKVIQLFFYLIFIFKNLQKSLQPFCTVCKRGSWNPLNHSPNPVPNFKSLIIISFIIKTFEFFGRQ